MATPIDWARLAAYIDGEGCIIITRQSPDDCTVYKQHHLMISITNCDPRLVTWCKAVFSCGNIHSRKRGQNRRCYCWAVSDTKAEWILENCFAYFVIKREQAEIGLAFRKTILRQDQQRNVPRDTRLDPGVLAARDWYKSQLSELKHKELPLV